MPSEFKLPKLYAIVDAGSFGPELSLTALTAFALELATAGVTLIQYRNERATARELLSHARELKRALPPTITLILNARADLAVAAGFHGVHLDQDGLSPESARLIIDPKMFVGITVHNPDQLAMAGSADYIAVQIDNIRHLRQLTRKPLVATGGITAENARSVLDAGADSVAVTADPRSIAADFLNL